MSWAITAVAVGTLTATSTAMSIRANNEAAQQQQESIAATTRMNYALKLQQEQEAKAKTGMELTQKSIEAFAERGRVQAAQAESGVAGASPLREFANTYLQESLAKGSIVSQGEAEQRSLALDNQRTYLEGLSQINQLESQKTSESQAWMSTILSGVQGGMSVYSMGSSIGGTQSTSYGTQTYNDYEKLGFEAEYK
jgi:hypothetical protein